MEEIINRLSMSVACLIEDQLDGTDTVEDLYEIQDLVTKLENLTT